MKQVIEVTGHACALTGTIGREMIGLVLVGATKPHRMKMVDWYKLIDHGQICLACTNEFEKLAIEARKKEELDGPTTLKRKRIWD